MGFSNASTYLGPFSAGDEYSTNAANSPFVQRSTLATRPTTGNKGVLWIDSSNGEMYWDSGSSWQLIPMGAGRGIYGDGSDGTVTLSSGTTFARDMYYDYLTVNSGTTLNLANFRLFAKHLVNNSGVIANNGAPGITPSDTGINAGMMQSTGSLAAGGNGGEGNHGVGNGGGAAAVTYAIGGNGGNGGALGSMSTAPGAIVTAPPASAGGYRDVNTLLRMTMVTGGVASTATWNMMRGGGGGGAGGGNTSTDAGSRGGGGGQGGGIVMIAGRVINNVGTIVANGGVGGNAQSSGASAGGGGGGGFIALIYDWLQTTGTIQVNAGIGGITASTNGLSSAMAGTSGSYVFLSNAST